MALQKEEEVKEEKKELIVQAEMEVRRSSSKCGF
jgi:hypothetical protein